MFWTHTTRGLVAGLLIGATFVPHGFDLIGLSGLLIGLVIGCWSEITEGRLRRRGSR